MLHVQVAVECFGEHLVGATRAMKDPVFRERRGGNRRSDQDWISRYSLRPYNPKEEETQP